MLHGPEVIEANLVGQLRLRHHLLVALVLDSLIVRFPNLDFVHQPEFHSYPSMSGCSLVGVQPEHKAFRSGEQATPEASHGRGTQVARTPRA
jgi:hypothetical protein